MIPVDKLKERVLQLMVEMLPRYGTPEDKIEEVVMYRESGPYKLFFVDTLESGYFFIYNGVVDDFWVFEQNAELPAFLELLYHVK